MDTRRQINESCSRRVYAMIRRDTAPQAARADEKLSRR
jgi:hypothetical protein